jgi:two-component system, response regulator
MIKKTVDILLVEDNPADIELTMEAFSESDLSPRIKVLHDGKEAVDYIFSTVQKDDGASDNPKLILLDLDLPKVSGLELLRKIKTNERTKMIPVVIMTSSFADQDRIECYQLGAYSYLIKPVGFDKFARDCVATSMQAIVRSEALSPANQ